MQEQMSSAVEQAEQQRSSIAGSASHTQTNSIEQCKEPVKGEAERHAKEKEARTGTPTLTAEESVTEVGGKHDESPGSNNQWSIGARRDQVIETEEGAGKAAVQTERKNDVSNAIGATS